MKVVRILIYEGSERWVMDTLSKSLPDGIKDIARGNLIKVATLGTMSDPVDVIFKEGEDHVL